MSSSITRISDLCEQVRGVTYSKAEASLTPSEGYKPVIRANNITENGLTFDDLVFVPKGRINNRQSIKENDVVIATSSESIDIVGKAARALTDFDGGFGAFCKVLRPNNKVDAGYFSHFFRTKQYRQRVSALASGANINNLRNEHLDDLEIQVPSIPEQRRIAVILDKADALRTKRREAIAKLDQLLKSVFLDMFGDPVTNPKGWAKLPLQDLCEAPDDIKCGPFGTQLAKSEFTKEGVPLWGIKNVNALFNRPTKEFVSAETAKRLYAYSIQSGDIVMTRKGTVGNCAIYPKGFPTGIMHSDLLRLRVSEKHCAPIFVSYQLHESQDVEQQMKLISGGAIMPGINVGRLKNLQVFVPPLAEQQTFAEVSEKFEQQKDRLQHHANQLDALFASLQHRAFAGEL